MKKNEPQLWSGINDLYFILILLVVSGLAAVAHNMSLSELVYDEDVKPKKYIIRILSPEYKKIVITEPKQEPFSVNGRNGTSVIEWNNEGSVRMLYSSCRGKQCKNVGWTKHRSIICLPNAVAIEIVTDEPNEFDGISR